MLKLTTKQDKCFPPAIEVNVTEPQEKEEEKEESSAEIKCASSHTLSEQPSPQ